MKKNAGFGLVYTIAAVLVVAVIVVAGVFIYKHNHKNVNYSTSSSSSSSQLPKQKDNTQTIDPYAGWKTYSSNTAGYSIKSPADWTVRTSTNSGGAEDTLITSPGNFQIEILSFSKSSGYWQQQGSSTDCGASCITVNQSTPISIPGYGTLNINETTGGAGGGTVNELLLLPSVNNILIASPTKPSIYTTFKGVFQGLNQDQQTAMTPSQFLASADVKTAVLIYKSVSF